MARRQGKRREQIDQATVKFDKGVDILQQQPMFAPLLAHAYVIRDDRYARINYYPEHGWADVGSDGYIYVHPTRVAEPDEWVYVLAHCLLHLGFGHFQQRDRFREWNTACDCFVTRFLNGLKIGANPTKPGYMPELPAQNEEKLYQEFCERGIPGWITGLGTAGPNANDMVIEPPSKYDSDPPKWESYFGQGLTAALMSAVRVAAGYDTALGADNTALTLAKRAKNWFTSSYPLLGSLAATFEIIEDAQICSRLGISVAAVDAVGQEIFVNPAAGMDDQECRFVMAHELLHVGLRHHARREGRDPFFWNLACDYVINGWLIEMGLGELPKLGALYDAQLKGQSAEAVYDRIVTDMRRYRKMCTLAGVGICDILDRGKPKWWESGDGFSLDDLYRRCLSQGLLYHEEQSRGLLPAGLIEEIRALSQPPIPWDVELAQWFDDHFSPLEKVRSYARPSRRQSATPDIPRPRYVPKPGSLDGRTYGVVLDTSGSMDKEILAKALGAIASYSISRDVPRVRVVFCDAEAYDQGYMAPEDIAGRVKVKGRGGTVLQPGVDLLEKSEDFPKGGPILIITDGECDRVRVRREHAYILPWGHSLPFVPKGKVFRIR